MTDQQPFSNSLFTGAPAGPTATPPPQRLFYYDNQLFEDPGPEYSVRDILNFLAQTYPELRQGSWSSRTLPDGTEEVTFHKVTGEKGAAPRRFLYKGQELEDPDPALPLWQARRMLSFSLRRPLVVGVVRRELPDGVETIILADAPPRVFRIGEDDYPDPAPLLPVSQVRQTFVAALGAVPHQWRIDKQPDGSEQITFYDPPAA